MRHMLCPLPQPQLDSWRWPLLYHSAWFVHVLPEQQPTLEAAAQGAAGPSYGPLASVGEGLLQDTVRAVLQSAISKDTHTPDLSVGAEF